MAQTASSPAHDGRLKVFYDGACPLCSAEIALYRRQIGAGALDFIDISDGTSPLPNGVQREDALARFHVQSPQGRVISGAAAFGEVMLRLDRWRMVAKVIRLPVVRTLAEGGYRAFLKLRPVIAVLFARLGARGRRAR